jgi:hypothetical protein
MQQDAVERGKDQPPQRVQIHIAAMPTVGPLAQRHPGLACGAIGEAASHRQHAGAVVQAEGEGKRRLHIVHPRPIRTAFHLDRLDRLDGRLHGRLRLRCLATEKQGKKIDTHRPAVSINVDR